MPSSSLSLSLLLLAASASATFAPLTTNVTSRMVVNQYTDAASRTSATLYALAAKGYDDAILLFNGTAPDHYHMGYAYGMLLAEQAIENYESLFNSLLPNMTLVQIVMEGFMDLQYSHYVSKNLPQPFLDELRGVSDAGIRAGHEKLGTYVTRAVTIAAIAVGSLESDLLYLIKGELFPSGTAASAAVKELVAGGMTPEEIARTIASSRIADFGRTCSMYGVWGSRTAAGSLFTGRNLDWAADTGIAKNKVVAVYHIGSAIPYATVGFAGLVGAITGMSAAGITVHEAGDDSTEVSLEGFVWPLRLRALMESSHTMADAHAFWAATNNTMGINHGIGSAADNRFMALETHAGYTAYFQDNDPREAALNIQGVQYGYPLPEALWRTNHGYDPTFLSKHVGGEKPGDDSFQRYLLLHDTFNYYQASGVAINLHTAVNITAIVGDKGGSTRESFLSCANASTGINIVSTAFFPKTNGEGEMFIAFENGHAQAHVPACCNYYVYLNMADYF